jgi:NADPH:quinone reductase-like Zn-dependent oxidoreductase
MRAIAVAQFRSEPALVELPEPEPKPGQLLVEVSVAGMNPFDWEIADGVMKDVMPHVFPLVLGQDAAGTVVGVGDAVTRFKVGDRVFGQFFHSPLGEGTYAEFTVVPETGTVALVPAALSDETAAALPTAGMTALAMIERLDLPPGSSVLIVGATGGVGSFATQLAAARGLHVLATAGAAGAERMRRYGASETFDYRAGDLGTRIGKSHPAGIDALIDLVSDAPTFAALASMVRKGASALTTTFVADEKALRAQGIQGGNFELKANAVLLQSLAGVVESGQLEVPVDANIALEDVPAAIARSRARRSAGKTVIRIRRA